MNEISPIAEIVPGRYRDMPKERYHSDPCPQPSLSSHIATTLIERSPRHAWHAHPRLNPNHESSRKKIFDIGHTAHGLMLNDPECKVKIVNAKAWRTKEHKAIRARAYADGEIPLLQKEADSVARMVSEGQLQLQSTETPDAFDGGASEQTLIWQEETPYGKIWCRCRIDWLPGVGPVIPFDYKTTGGSAHPDAFYASAWDNGYYFQSEFYKRGIRAVLKTEPPEFRFVVQETKSPYALSVCCLTPMAVAEASELVEEAIELWGWCIYNDRWPGYSGKIAYIDTPIWVQRRREALKERNLMLRMNGIDPREVMIEWQRPVNSRP